MAEAEEVFAPRSVLLPGRRSLMVRLTCNDGMRPALLDVLNSYADGLGEEPGTELFVVSLDPDDETIVWLYEIFKFSAQPCPNWSQSPLSIHTRASASAAQTHSTSAPA